MKMLESSHVTSCESVVSQPYYPFFTTLRKLGSSFPFWGYNHTQCREISYKMYSMAENRIQHKTVLQMRNHFGVKMRIVALKFY